MKTIAHISDLHFGREDPQVAETLVRDLEQVRPTLLVNSGDLTQRARAGQFRAAAQYAKRLPQPQLTVPGNHDIPLYDVARRFLSPLTRYRRYIHEDVDPTYQDEQVAVLGLNTARSMTWKNGRISLEQIAKMERFLGAVPDSRVKIVVTHHPFIPPPGDEDAGIALVGRAREALDVIDRCGVDLLLAGHVHHGYTGDIRTHYPRTRRSIVVAQAGTAISHRIRREPNAYNVVRVDRDHIEISVRRHLDDRFAETGKARYRREGDAWKLEESRYDEREGPRPMADDTVRN